MKHFIQAILMSFLVLSLCGLWQSNKQVNIQIAIETDQKQLQDLEAMQGLLLTDGRYLWSYKNAAEVKKAEGFSAHDKKFREDMQLFLAALPVSAPLKQGIDAYVNERDDILSGTENFTFWTYRGFLKSRNSLISLLQYEADSTLYKNGGQLPYDRVYLQLLKYRNFADLRYAVSDLEWFLSRKIIDQDYLSASDLEYIAKSLAKIEQSFSQLLLSIRVYDTQNGIMKKARSDDPFEELIYTLDDILMEGTPDGEPDGGSVEYHLSAKELSDRLDLFVRQSAANLTETMAYSKIKQAAVDADEVKQWKGFIMSAGVLFILLLVSFIAPYARRGEG